MPLAELLRTVFEIAEEELSPSAALCVEVPDVSERSQIRDYQMRVKHVKAHRLPILPLYLVLLD
jgi:hypothetical protein